MKKSIRRLATAAVAAAALALPAAASANRAPPPQHAAPVTALQHAAPVTSALFGQNGGWAGDVAHATHPKTDPMRVIAAQFTIPPVNCAKSLSYDGRTFPVYSEATMWAGFGGYNDAQLEQAGILVVCGTKTSDPVYGAFSEILPAQDHIMLTPGPDGKKPTGQLVTADGKWITPTAGDTIDVVVQDLANTVTGTKPYLYDGAPAGHNFELQVIDESQGDAQWISTGWSPQTAAPSATKPNPDAENTAEVITEAVSGGLDAPKHIGIADVGPVTYHNILATDYGKDGGLYGADAHGLSTSPGLWTTKGMTVGGAWVVATFRGAPYFKYVPGIFAISKLTNINGDYPQYGAGDHAFTTYSVWSGS